MKQKNGNLTLVIAVTISLAFIIYSIVNFNTEVNLQLETTTKSTLTDIAKQQQIAFDNELKDQRQLAISIAELVTQIPSDDESIVGYMQTMEANFGFDSIVFADRSGKGILSTREYVNISDAPYFDRTINGEVVTSEPYTSAHTGHLVFAVSAPIYEYGEIVGVVAVEYTLDYFISLLEAYVDERGYALVVRSDGEALVSTDPDYITFSELAQARIQGTTIEEIASNLVNGVGCSIDFTIENTEYIAVYQSLIYNDWSIVLIIEEDLVTSGTRAVADTMINISIIITLCSFLFVVYIVLIRKQNLQEIEQIAYYDELTGLPNLNKFKIEVERAIEENPEKNFVMVKLDIVNFKAINEMFSFEIGNQVIKTIAEVGEWIDEKIFIQARTGPDEFMLFSDGDFLKNLEKTKSNYEAIFKQLVTGVEKHQFNFRYGRYFLDNGDKDINVIINKTSMAHSTAKSGGAENIMDYDNAFSKKVVQSTDITNKMQDALENREFKVYLQPKFSIVDSEIVGAEALVRWVESSGNMIFPNDFIPLFEKNGFIVELDNYMLKCVCEHIREWLDKGMVCVPISVNFSRVHMKNPYFVSEIFGITEQYGVPTEYIEVELTETTITENEHALEKLLDDLHEVGFAVSIDDFGAGYSSLGMLKNFRVDTLKLDRSFFVDSGKSDRGDLVVDGIISLAHTLHMYTVAEGIETQEQVDFLKEVECNAAQGYFFEKPMPVADYEKKYLTK